MRVVGRDHRKVKQYDSESGSQIEQFYRRTLQFNRGKNADAGRNPAKGKGPRESFFVYIPQVTKEERTVLDLSIRGGAITYGFMTWLPHKEASLPEGQGMLNSPGAKSQRGDNERVPVD
jgi:hypothetical protein